MLQYHSGTDPLVCTVQVLYVRMYVCIVWSGSIVLLLQTKSVTGGDMILGPLVLQIIMYDKKVCIYSGHYKMSQCLPILSIHIIGVT